MRLPSLNHLRTFQLAARHLSFKNAAEELFVTPSAVSHQVRALEGRLGLTLFDRKTRALELTEAGQAYFSLLDTLFARLEAETDQLRDRYGRDILRLSLPPFFASEAVLPAIGSYQERHPATDIRIVTQPSSMDVHPAEADVSILVGNGQWQGLEAHRLFAHRFVVACAPSLLGRIDPQSASPLDGQTLIVHEGRRSAWDRWSDSVGAPRVRPGKLIRLDSMSAIARAAEKGLGFALVSWPLGKAWFHSGGLSRVFEEEFDTGDSFFLVLRPEEGARQEVQNLKNWLLDNFHADA
jgi:LysR family glycine cleavage system transcriptional activator